MIQAMTYLFFHLRFILPLIVILWLLLPRQQTYRRMGPLSIITLSLLAFVYATPWDNWLVANAIWSYGDDRVLATIGYVPVEEYLFFILQPMLTGLWFYLMLANIPAQWVDGGSRGVRWGAAALLLVAAALSGLLLLAPDNYRYLAMILVWACPVLALHWAIGGDQLLRNAWLCLAAIVPPTVYLGIADRFAIQAGVWHITEQTSTQIMVFGLPVEELLFFFITNIMVVQGLLLFVWVLEARPFDDQWQRVKRVWRLLTDITRPLLPPDGAQRSIMRHIIVPSYIVTGLFALLFLLPVAVPVWIQLLPLVLSAALFGLPHGAIDHLVPGKVLGQPLALRQMGVFLTAYIIPVFVMIGVWAVAPVAGFVFFILLTWFHWGLGDLHAVLAFSGADFLNSRAHRALAALIRGALPMMVPLVFSPGDYSMTAEAVASSFGAVNMNAIAWAFGSSFRASVAVVLLTLIVISAGFTLPRARRDGQMRAWWVYVGEVGLLLAYFALVPPLLAIGVYFCLWHSTRHIARLLLLDEPSTAALERGQTGVALGRFFRQAAPLTGVALAMLGGLYVLVPTQPDDLLAAVGLYLALIAGLTVPHTLVVTWMDAVQGVWRPAPATPPRQPSLAQSPAPQTQ